MTYKNKTVQRHKRGNWYARVRLNGKVICVYGRTQAETYTKLKVLCDKVEQEKLALGLQRVETLSAQIVNVKSIKEVKAKKTYTLREWFDEWLHSYKVGNVRASTIGGFKMRFKNLENLYDVEIDKITNLMLSRAINEITSNAVKDAVHNLLKQMFSAAFNNRLIETNPTANIPRPKQVVVYEKQAFTQEQEKRFIDLCLADLDLYEPFIICILQGLRKGEMLALRPNDLDFENNTLRIDESYDHDHPDDLQTKNPASNRTMPMFGVTRQVLLKYANAAQNERIYGYKTTALLARLGKLLKENNLPRLTIHQLRHTFISRCHEKGIDELIVQKWVGHAKGSRMTKAVYTHISDEAERKYIETMNGKKAG